MRWRQLLWIQVGGAICLPVILVGQMLAKTYGLGSALLAIGMGNAALLILGLVSAHMSVTEPKTTVEHAASYFGVKGKRFFALLFFITMLGWFAIQLNVMAISALSLTTIAIAPWMVNLILGGLITGGALYGIRGLHILSEISLPLLVGTLAVAMFHVKGEVEVSALPLTLSGISLVVATAISAVIDMPTYFRHAVSKRQAMLATIGLFGIAMPLIEYVGIYLGMHSQGKTILDALTAGGGTYWNLWVALFLIMAGWTTNNTNLYSAQAASESLFPRLSSKKRVLLIGSVGTALSCVGILDHFEMALEIMGIGMASMAAVMLASYLLQNRAAKFLPNVTIWAVGTSIGLLSLKGWSMTHMPVVDAFMGATIMTLIKGKKDAVFNR